VLPFYCMATILHIPLQEYLGASFSPDREYVDGEIRERNVGKWEHARVQIALLAEGDHLFDMRADCLGLCHGGLHAVFDEDGRDQVAQQRAAVAGVASEFESCITMAHGETLFR